LSRRQADVAAACSAGGRLRADLLLVDQGLAVDSDEAARLIMAGQAWAGTERLDKPGQLLAADLALRVERGSDWASRGALKLSHALEVFDFEVTDRVCLDAGASSGGFTDCLLRAGASRVYAVDVGYGQLDWRLRGDPRVVVMERCNVRAVDREQLSPPPTLVVADLSFVSLTTLLEKLSALAGPAGELLLLVKPQFETTRDKLEGGILRDDAERGLAVQRVVSRARELGLTERGQTESPVTGARGNRELLLHFTVGADASG